MSTLGEQLRLAREAQGRTLDDIAHATRISKKFLEELEQDRTPTLPATYVHAFIKTFAVEVGLDPAALLASVTPAPTEPPQTTRSFTEPASAEQPMDEKPTEVQPAKRQTWMLVGLFFLIAAGLLLSILWLRDERRAQSGQEISFSDVVKEQEGKRAVRATDSAAVSLGRSKRSVPQDSLFLEGVASESAWVRIIIDSGKPSEYTLPPSYHMRWRAKKNFLVSVGNASVVAFTLNGKHLGTLGKEPKPARNVSLSHETLQGGAQHAPKKDRDGAH